jgi:hypothetical protein
MGAMKTGLVVAALLALVVVVGGCATGGASSGSYGGARCLSRPDTSGTQPMFYLLCIQSS